MRLKVETAAFESLLVLMDPQVGNELDLPTDLAGRLKELFTGVGHTLINKRWNGERRKEQRLGPRSF